MDHKGIGLKHIMNWQERIIIGPEILAGKPIVNRTRLAVEFTVDLLASEWTEEEILRFCTITLASHGTIF